MVFGKRRRGTCKGQGDDDGHASSRKWCIRQPKQKRSEETRKKILEAGLRCFEREGFHATSSKKIAREAGVSVGSFYSYFKDKKHLLCDLIEQKITGLYEMLESVPDRADLQSLSEKDVVRMMVVQARSMHIWSHEFNRELSILGYTDDDVRRFKDEMNAKFVQVIVKLFESNRERVRVTDLEAAAHIVRGTIEHFIHEFVNFGAPIEEERMVDALVDMVHAYLFEPTGEPEVSP